MKRKTMKGMSAAIAIMMSAALLAGCGSSGTGGSGSTASAGTTGASGSSEIAAAVSTGEETASSDDTAAAAAAKEAQDQAAQAAASADEQAVAGSIYITGYEWGPGVNKVIIQVPETVDSVDADGAVMNTLQTERKVTDAYLSDALCNKVDGPSQYVTLELETTFTASGDPFIYDAEKTMMNHWADSYPVITRFNVTASGTTKSVGMNADLIDYKICPQTEAFNDRGSYTETVTNPMTNAQEEETLQYAAYEPDTLYTDGVQNPLVIWLHGQGEGGTDPDIAILGNEVSALTEDEIQSQYTTENGSDGAYVLVVQCPTYWMDGGDGTNSNGDLTSKYTQILMDTIEEYVGGHSDVDTNRIYLGGCSNGGYMTVNMLVNYPDYWAAAYPMCEAYAFYMFERDADGNYVTKSDGNAMGGTVDRVPTTERWMTDEKINAIKDIPIWFAATAADTIVNPAQFSLPTYQALLQAGATNVWYSYYETVQGSDDPKATYQGHWVWTYLFNNKMTKVQDISAIKDSKDTETFGFTPNNDGGGTKQASDANGTYDTIFAWMNAQSK